MVMGQGVRLTAAGLAIGLALTAAATRLMMALLYGVNPAEPRILAAAAAALAAVALIACGAPSVRALRIRPGVALRYE